MRTSAPVAGLALVLALGCQQAQAPAPETTEKTATVIAGVGFSTPEAILHDGEADVYLVSQINGNPLETDGNGFVSRVSPDGTVAELRWIDGRDGDTELHAPKGMAFVGDRLYVADIDAVRVFDRASGEPKGEIVIEGATYAGPLEGPYEVLVDGIESPADIAVDAVRRALIIPSFNGHDLMIRSLK